MKLLAGLLLVGVLCTGCGSSSPTTPSSTTTTTTTTSTTIAAPTTTEEWDSTVPVGGFKFYSFTVTQNGTVNVSLTAVSGQFVPATVTLGLGLGQPSGTDCTTTTSMSVNAQTAQPQITGTYAPGVYCVRLYDVGNLFAPANFTVLVAHP